MTSCLVDSFPEQCASGAFPSWVTGFTDQTCFVTASVALLLDPRRHASTLHRALDFIETCEQPGTNGSFTFYPSAAGAPRLVCDLPPDADDTALAWLALLHGRRRTLAAGIDAFERHIAPASCRLVPGDAPPWIRPGAVRTWLVERGSCNPFDLTVNANVTSLAQRLGLDRHPAGVGARASLIAASTGPFEPHRFARRLTPYYADVSELWVAVDRAVSFGVASLSGVLLWLRATCAPDPWRPDKPLYCNEHGLPYWSSPALQSIRRRMSPRRESPLS